MSSLSSAKCEATSNGWVALDATKLSEIENVCKRCKLPLMERLILVNINTQRLFLVDSHKQMQCYLISTALNGTGQQEGTGKTPLGLHFVKSKIGGGAKPLEIFKSRVSLGEIATADIGKKCVVGRILWLQGVEPGFNQGKNSTGQVVDTYDRYIYIHGTNDIANIGKPASEGCVRMKPDDVIDLFEKVPVGTPVYIYQA